MSIKIEEVDPSTQAVWREIGRRSFRRDEVGYEFGDILPMDPGVLEIQRDSRDAYLVATLNGEPAGRLLIEEHAQDDGTPYSILRDVAVAPEARRRGVGRALVDEARRRFKAARLMSAETDLEDLSMYHFFKACGLQRDAQYGFSAWVLMDYPYRQKTLERVDAVRKAGIEIRDPGIADPDELTAAVWSRWYRDHGGKAVPAARAVHMRRFVACGGRTFFAYKDGAHIGTTQGLPRTNTYSSGRFFRDPLVGTLAWIESAPEHRQTGLATALVHRLMESFRADGSRFFFYRGFSYDVASHRVGMGMGRAYLRATIGWTAEKH